jgi:transposase
MITELSKQIDILEQEMESIIGSNAELASMFDLLLSVRCIGKQAALFLIVCTGGFTKFKNARQFAAYCGVAPFPNQSGTSLKGRSQVSHLANKKMKSLLDMCAKSSIRHNMEIKEYYQRRVALGKNKMSTINIIRNKLLSRVFAVIHRGTPYVDLYKYAS